VVAYNKCVKKAVCADDEILNPDTNRCVKRTGAVGRRILAAAAAGPARQPAPAIPARIVPAPARQLFPEAPAIPAAAQHPKFMIKVEFKKSKNNTIFTLELDSSSQVFKITKNNETMEEKNKPLDVLLRKMFTAYESLMVQGFKPKVLKMEHPEQMDVFIKETQLCKLNPNVSECVNSDTMYTLEPLKDQPPDKIIKLVDGYCFLVDELVDSIVATKDIVNPITKVALSLDDINKLKQHRALDRDQKKKLEVVLKGTVREVQSFESALRAKEKDVKDMLLLMLYVGMHCVKDYSNDFADSTLALSYLQNKMDTLDTAVRDVILTIAIPGSTKLADLMRTYHSICIHGVGYQLTGLIIHTCFKYKCEDVLRKSKLFYLVHSAPPFDYALEISHFVSLNFVHLYRDNKFIRVWNYYVQGRNVRYIPEGAPVSHDLIPRGLDADILSNKVVVKTCADIFEEIATLAGKKEDLYQGCSNDVDPITQDAFSEMPIRELKNIVRIGRNHCYTLGSIFEIYKNAIMNGIPFKDALDPSHIVTEAEKQHIDNMMKNRDPHYRRPERPRPISELWTFEVLDAGMHHWRVRLVPKAALFRGNAVYQAIIIGLIPSDIETRESDINSAVLLTNIRTLFEQHKLLDTYHRPTPVLQRLQQLITARTFNIVQVCNYVSSQL
jgi:hypothetical protein